METTEMERRERDKVTPCNQRPVAASRWSTRVQRAASRSPRFRPRRGSPPPMPTNAPPPPHPITQGVEKERRRKTQLPALGVALLQEGEPCAQIIAQWLRLVLSALARPTATHTAHRSPIVGTNTAVHHNHHH
uniref:Uncharacterized protein n=1 Tax=Plectus sambesii TaxID=2011161 RepID=A0A914VHB5_9BILA